jgi:quercetin dioxygenase-like cupin family protein/DNA-binding XRE family transcriptional regulator
VTLRDLAERAGVSASLLSRVENEKSQPSVSTLYAVVSALGFSMDALFTGATPTVRHDAPDDSWTNERVPPDDQAVEGTVANLPFRMAPGILRSDDRAHITLDSGVTWEKLTAKNNEGVDFLYVTYEPGGRSHSSGHLMRHQGVEWVYVNSGTLVVTVLFDEYVIHAGDTITFHSSMPHRLENHSDEPAQLICVIFGRESMFEVSQMMASDGSD